jgi:hypothetical protein
VAQSDGGFAIIIGLLIVAGMWFFIFNSSSSNSLWYSFKYNVSLKDVRTDTKPDDCDFLRAPMGLKGCSYRARVQAFNADEMMVAGEGAPAWSAERETGKPIISWDSGKTWYLYTGTDDLKPRSVRVSWVKE